MEKITIPNVGEIPMDHLSHFLGALVESVDLYRDLSLRFNNARMLMCEGLDATNTTREHSNLIEGCREVSCKIDSELQKKAFADVISLVDSICR